MDSWNSKQYLKFEKERTQPAIDLVNRLNINKPEKIIDIGCGPGNSTEILKSKFKEAYILGVDSSEDMINTAKNKYPNIEWRIFDAEKDFKGLDNDYDIVFSNACIQWIPNHYRLIDKMMNLLKKGGILAVQIPNNYNEYIHKIMKEVASSNKWSSSFKDIRKMYILSPNDYYDIISEKTNEFNIWEEVYYHDIDSHEDIIEWYKGTGLRPYLNQLSSEKQLEFEADILNQVKENYLLQKNGHIIFRFPRLFFTAEKK